MVELIKDELYALLVPDDARDFCLSKDEPQEPTYLNYEITVRGNPYRDGYNTPRFSPYDKIIGLFKDITEEQAVGLVAKSDSATWYAVYVDYTKEEDGCWMALGSLKSLLKSKGLDPSQNNYLLIKKTQMTDTTTVTLNVNFNTTIPKELFERMNGREITEWLKQQLNDATEFNCENVQWR